MVEMAEKPNSQTIRAAMIIRPAGRTVPEAAVREIARMEQCGSGKCVVQWIDDKRFVLLSRRTETDFPGLILFRQNDSGSDWSSDFLEEMPKLNGGLEQAEIVIRPVTRQQVSVNGQPVGKSIE